MLRVYVSGHCPTCGTARERFAQLQARHPDIPAQLIDVDEPGAAVPPQVIGTPIYTWRGRVIFRGNPGERELLARVGGLDADGGAH
jgi:hypothetical protein